MPTNRRNTANSYSRSRTRYKVSHRRKNSGRLIFASAFAVVVACAFGLSFCWYMGIGVFAPRVDNNTKIISLESVSSDSVYQETVEFALTQEMLANIPNSDTPVGFSLSTLSATDLSAGELQVINDALAGIPEDATAGFILLNMNTGRGLAYKADAGIYGDTSIISSYATFVCEQVVDSQKAYFSEERDNLEKAIIERDEEAYRSLREKFDSMGWQEYLTALNASSCYVTGSVYSTYSARTSMSLWFHTMSYIDLVDERPAAAFLYEAFKQTNPAYVRTGLANVPGAVVQSMAGSYAGDSSGANSLCDCGVIQIGDVRYLLCIMSSMKADEANSQVMNTLVKAIMNARDETALQTLTKTTITNPNGTTEERYTNKNGTVISR